MKVIIDNVEYNVTGILEDYSNRNIKPSAIRYTLIPNSLYSKMLDALMEKIVINKTTIANANIVEVSSGEIIVDNNKINKEANNV